MQENKEILTAEQTTPQAEELTKLINGLPINYQSLDATSRQLEQYGNEAKGIKDFSVMLEVFNLIQKRLDEVQELRNDTITPLLIELEKFGKSPIISELIRNCNTGTTAILIIEKTNNGHCLSIKKKVVKQGVTEILLNSPTEKNKQFGDYKALFEHLTKEYKFNIEKLPEYDKEDKNKTTLNLFTGNLSKNREYFENWSKENNLYYILERNGKSETYFKRSEGIK